MKIINKESDFIVFTYYSLTYKLELKEPNVAGTLYLVETSEVVNNNELLEDICNGFKILNIPIVMSENRVKKDLKIERMATNG